MGESVAFTAGFWQYGQLDVWQDHFNRYFRLQLGPAEGSVADMLTTCSIWQVLVVRPYHYPGMLNWMLNFRATGAKGQILDYQETKQGIRPWA